MKNIWYFASKIISLNQRQLNSQKIRFCIQDGPRYIYFDGKFKDPNIGDISEETHEHVKLDQFEEYQSDLQDIVHEIRKSSDKNDWVAVTYGNKCYPGVITELC